MNELIFTDAYCRSSAVKTLFTLCTVQRLQTARVPTVGNSGRSDLNYIPPTAAAATANAKRKPTIVAVPFGVHLSSRIGKVAASDSRVLLGQLVIIPDRFICPYY